MAPVSRDFLWAIFDRAGEEVEKWKREARGSESATTPQCSVEAPAVSIPRSIGAYRPVRKNPGFSTF
jgi:hypothetical protein